MMKLSESLASYIRSVSYEELPDDVVEFTKLCILDYFSSAIAGSDTPPITKV
ncbi:MmgE/PrpD family protein, partial [Salinicoccus roseus]|uniref:MmgE/PrpD family protein n=1 Tax=Salinicoccus roseus TaxID=45670 RepID=UPI00292F5B5D